MQQLADISAIGVAQYKVQKGFQSSLQTLVTGGRLQATGSEVRISSAIPNLYHAIAQQLREAATRFWAKISPLYRSADILCLTRTELPINEPCLTARWTHDNAPRELDNIPLGAEQHASDKVHLANCFTG